MRQALRNLSIRWKLGLHLVLILALIGVNIGGVWLFLAEQEQDGTAINTAGEQRMLTQKMTWEAHQVGMGETDQRAELERTADRYDRQLTALIEGNETMGLPPAPDGAQEQLTTVQTEWEPFYEHVQTVVEEPHTSEAFANSLEYIEAQNENLLAETDSAVKQYEAAYDEKVMTLQQFLLAIFLVDLIVIASIFKLTDWHVLRPLDRLTSDALRVAHGETDRQIDVVDSDDEIGNLSRAIHGMKEQLLSTIQETKQFEKAVEHAGHAIYITDSEGTITYANTAFEELTGYSKTEVVGENPRILNSGHQSESHYENLWETIRSGDVWNEEIVNQRATGELFHAYQAIAPITNGQGEIDRFVAIMTDQTDQIVRKQQTQVLSRALRHNLRNELNVIKLSAQELVDSQPRDSQGRHVDKILQRIEELEELSETASRFDYVLDDETFRRSLSVCPTAERIGETITDRYPDAVVTVDCDVDEREVRTSLDLILEELLENAIIHNDQEEATIRVAVTTHGENPSTVGIEIEDNGPGIPENERAVIEEGEEPSLYHGSGLGLWIVYWLTTLAGGTVSIDDSRSGGARITLVLPSFDVSSAQNQSTEELRISNLDEHETHTT